MRCLVVQLRNGGDKHASSNRAALWSVRYNVAHTEAVLGYLEFWVPHLRFLVQPRGSLVDDDLAAGFCHGPGPASVGAGPSPVVLIGADMEAVLAGLSSLGGRPFEELVQYRPLESRLRAILRAKEGSAAPEEEGGPADGEQREGGEEEEEEEEEGNEDPRRERIEGATGASSLCSSSSCSSARSTSGRS